MPFRGERVKIPLPPLRKGVVLYGALLLWDPSLSSFLNPSNLYCHFLQGYHEKPDST